MRVCQLELRNFRGVRTGCISLPKHAVLLGANNVGKTTVVEALALLFGRDRMVRPISDWDFFGGSPKAEDRFYVIATLTDFPSQDPAQVPDWFLGEDAARPVWWDDARSLLEISEEPTGDQKLAAQVALAARYEEETSEFETLRYFYYGDSDPFTDGCATTPWNLLREVGLFLLSANRDWDKLLSFASSSLLKFIKEQDALPGTAIERLKQQLRTEVSKIEESEPLATILRNAVEELRSFMLIEQRSSIAYRPTTLDTAAVLQSLVAHIARDNGTLLPMARHGAGTVSIQAFLLLLGFASQRKLQQRNFILAAEEPELHLHPSLHQRLVHRIRAESAQSIVTTQSPQVAAAYQPSEVLVVTNEVGALSARPVRTESIKKIASNSVRKLYLQQRQAFYDALMAPILLVPEGQYDYEWLALWQRVAQAASNLELAYGGIPISCVPTNDAAIVDTFLEISQFRPDAIPFLDGDSDGEGYLQQLRRAFTRPTKVLRLGDNAGIECLSAWILEPSLNAPGDQLARILGKRARTLKELQIALFEVKSDREVHESIAWEAQEQPDCMKRVASFLGDVNAIAAGGVPNGRVWELGDTDDIQVFTATTVRKL